MMQDNSEPEEIIEARELLREFERSTDLSRKSCFAKGITILNDFLAEHPASEFSQRVNNLKNGYTKSLIKRLGTTPFSNFSDWSQTFLWVFTVFWDDEGEKLGIDVGDPELKEGWDNFMANFPYLKNK